jgi:ribosomal protein S27AE
MDDWDEEDYDHDKADCLCEDADMDLIEGHAVCPRCGRSWMMSSEEIKRELQFQAEYFETMAAEHETASR